jgi:hypothetical protein
VALGLIACRAPTPADPSATSDPALSDERPRADSGVPPIAPLHSPFAVEVQAELPFTQISFKQVGSFRSEGDRARLFETIAESVAYELTHGPTAWSSETAYTPELADPSHHVACGAAHIYVDFWEKDGDGWGFSLWSGCGEESRFAVGDVPVAAPVPNLTDRVQPLAQRIASALARAHRSDCYRARC